MMLQTGFSTAWMDLMKTLPTAMLEFVRTITLSAIVDAVFQLIKHAWMDPMIHRRHVIMITSGVQLDSVSRGNIYVTEVETLRVCRLS